MAKKVSFEVTEQEMAAISKIAKRAVEMASVAGVDYDMMCASMDITACHANGNPLKLEELLNADDFNFSHDVFGIRRHIDRDTGELTGHFLPRYSQQTPKYEASMLAEGGE